MRSNGAVWRAGLAGIVAGLVVVTALKLARALPLMPVDWALAAWTGATTLGLVAALRRPPMPEGATTASPTAATTASTPPVPSTAAAPTSPGRTAATSWLGGHGAVDSSPTGLPSPAVTGLDHVQLAMPPGGEAEARTFYVDLLGLREVPKPAPLAARGGCWFEDERLRLHLGVEDPFQPARKAHPGLAVSDLDALSAALAAAGVLVRPATPALPDARQAYVDDPFGNRIELIERLPAG